MRADCPSCGAAYDIPEQRLGPAVRRLRCARCAYEWTIESATRPAAPPALPPEPLTPPPVSPAPSAGTVAPRPSALPPYEEPRRFAWGALAAWVVSIVVLAGLGYAAVAFRAEIMQAWPPSQRLYELFGVGRH